MPPPPPASDVPDYQETPDSGGAVLTETNQRGCGLRDGLPGREEEVRCDLSESP